MREGGQGPWWQGRLAGRARGGRQEDLAPFGLVLDAQTLGST